MALLPESGSLLLEIALDSLKIYTVSVHVSCTFSSGA